MKLNKIVGIKIVGVWNDDAREFREVTASAAGGLPNGPWQPLLTMLQLRRCRRCGALTWERGTVRRGDAWVPWVKCQADECRFYDEAFQ